MNPNAKRIQLVASIALGLLLAIPVLAQATSRPTDLEITGWVKQALREDPRVFAGDIQVSTDDGIVKLVGSVWSLAEHDYANLETMKIRGVRGVVDEVRVAPDPRSDDLILHDIEHRLQTDAALGDESIHVAVHDGVAVLTGKVDSYTKKQEAAIRASEVLGLRKLDNQIRTAWQTSRDDAEIQKDLEATFLRDVYLVNQPITCAVDDGVVTLSGDVGTPYQKERAAQLAWIDNVKQVVNELRIEPWLDAGVRRTPPEPTDSELVLSVNAELMHDLRMDAPYELNVAADRGNVILTGTVPSFIDKRLAAEDARNVVGVGWVTDRVEVNPRRWPDDEIAAAVSFDLDSDWALSRQHIRVRADRGMVVLEGRVNTSFDKVRAGEVASRVRGVRDVMNDLVVSQPSPARDASIANRVRARLDADWLTSWLEPDIRVSVHDREVKLTGHVDTWAERTEAGRIAARTEGVWRVDNELAVADIDYPWAAMQDLGPYVLRHGPDVPEPFVFHDLDM